MTAKAKYEYAVEIYKRKDGLWESRVRLAHGKKNVIFTSAGQGYERMGSALSIVKNVFAGCYGVKFMVQQADKSFKEVHPW